MSAHIPESSSVPLTNPKANAARVLLAACKRVRWFNPAPLDEVTPELCEVVARCLASYAFSHGPEVWEREVEALRVAWGAYCELEEAADRTDEEAQTCQF